MGRGRGQPEALCWQLVREGAQSGGGDTALTWESLSEEAQFEGTPPSPPPHLYVFFGETCIQGLHPFLIRFLDFWC